MRPRVLSVLIVLCAMPFMAFCASLPPTDQARSPLVLDGLEAGPSILYVSEAGSDSHPGTSPGQPLRTLAAAAERAGAGTTVRIAGGTYHEQLRTVRGGAPGHPITFESYGGTAILDGSRLPWRAKEDQNQGLVELRHSNVRLEGLKIGNSKNTGVVLAADNLTIRGCEIANLQRHAISTDTSRQVAAGGTLIRNITLEGNDIHDATLAGSGYGQAISLIAEDFVIQGNRVYDNRDIGIDVWLGARHGEVTGNEVHGNGSTGIYVDGAAYVRIHGNAVHDNRHGIILSSEDKRYRTHHVWVYNNVVHDHRSGNGCGTWDPDTGVQDAVFAHNTLVDNQRSFYLSGADNTVEIANNLGFALQDDLIDRTSVSAISRHSNVWLPHLAGFRSVSGRDFRLTPGSAAIDRGQPLAAFRDDRGRTFAIATDVAGTPRRSRQAPDAGAYELP